MDETEAKDILEVAATEPVAPEVENPLPETHPVDMPQYRGVIGHIRAVIEATANDLGADAVHVRDMIFKHL